VVKFTLPDSRSLKFKGRDYMMQNIQIHEIDYETLLREVGLAPLYFESKEEKEEELRLATCRAELELERQKQQALQQRLPLRDHWEYVQAIEHGVGNWKMAEAKSDPNDFVGIVIQLLKSSRNKNESIAWLFFPNQPNACMAAQEVARAASVNRIWTYVVPVDDCERVSWAIDNMFSVRVIIIPAKYGEIED
jgi:hypothetical protein